jgi:translation initiation factor 2 alpha subunit (eIF-2alpha)
MDAENRQRQDISPYERACDYKRWIESGIYQNYTEIINALGVKKSWFSQLIALAELKAEIISAFGHPVNLKQKWGYELLLRCKSSRDTETAMLKLARELRKQNYSPVEVYQKLKNVNPEGVVSIHKENIIVKDEKGMELFEVQFTKGGSPRFVFRVYLKESLIDSIIQQTKVLIEAIEQ